MHRFYAPGAKRISSEATAMVASAQTQRLNEVEGDEMIKMVGPTNRNDLMSREAYVDYYTSSCAAVSSRIPSLVKYFANPALRAANGGDPAFDSVAEMYWPTIEAARAVYLSDEWHSARTDHVNGVAGRIMFLAEETEFHNSLPANYLDENPDGVKYLAFLNRKDGLSREAFQRYWFEQHVPLALETPRLRRYRASIALVSFNGDAPLKEPGDSPPWDGVVEMWFDTVEDFDESFRHVHWTKLRRDYYDNFAMGRLQLLVRENLVMDAT